MKTSEIKPLFKITANSYIQVYRVAKNIFFLQEEYCCEEKQLIGFADTIQTFDVNACSNYEKNPIMHKFIHVIDAKGRLMMVNSQHVKIEVGTFDIKKEFEFHAQIDKIIEQINKEKKELEKEAEQEKSAKIKELELKESQLIEELRQSYKS